MSWLIRIGPGITTSPLSTTRMSGRTAASSALMSDGSATSQTTAPGLQWARSSTRWPKAEVAVMTRSQSPTRPVVSSAISTRAPGVSASIVALSARSRSGSIETSTRSPAAWAISREQTEPIAPVAPTTMARPRVRSRMPIRCNATLAVSSVAATVRLLPVVTGIGASRATVTPASPTTLVKAPSPRICAPPAAAIRDGAHQPVVGEARRPGQHLSRRGAEGEEPAFDALPGRRRASAGDVAERPGGHVRGKVLDQTRREQTGPAEGGVAIDEADRERVDDEREAMGLGRAALFVARRWNRGVGPPRRP